MLRRIARARVLGSASLLPAAAAPTEPVAAAPAAAGAATCCTPDAACWLCIQPAFRLSLLSYSTTDELDPVHLGVLRLDDEAKVKEFLQMKSCPDSVKFLYCFVWLDVTKPRLASNFHITWKRSCSCQIKLVQMVSY